MSGNATVNYHAKSTEPQAFQFDVDGIVGNIISPELLPTDIHVRDVRHNLDAINFDNDGIIFRHYQSQIQDFSDTSEWQDIYAAELDSILKEQIQAKDVMVFDHTVRIDDQNAKRKPARNVHNDYSPRGAEQRLIKLVGKERAKEYVNGHYGFVNIWRPIKHTIQTSPLGFIRPSSMKSDDWMDIELIYPDRQGQILGVAANKNHDWFYLSEMTPDEITIFNIFDNQDRPHLAHSALDMHEKTHSKAPRMSIESRTLIRYS
ncbi:CmcJ/NvfI family oxidoreductase [Kiloniella sp.]|uniref:CmcJ/NvfI family oxidoreductase n=1 Tax=Kiloniella sp. TaxID=1938587 RepID=UPI003A8D0F11